VRHITGPQSGPCDYGHLKGVSGWKDIVQVAAGSYHTVGLKKDGTVVAVGPVVVKWARDPNARGQVEGVGDWKDIVQVAAGLYHTVGLKKDGTVVAVGGGDDGQLNVRGWKDVVQVATGFYHTVGLKKDGTVVAVGPVDGRFPWSHAHGQVEGVSGWKDIVQVAAGSYHTVGLKKDGTVVAVGRNSSGQCDVKDWKDIRTGSRREGK